jgi:hypothetical protein
MFAENREKSQKIVIVTSNPGNIVVKSPGCINSVDPY